MKTLKILLPILLMATFFFSCQKEYSFEINSNPSDGSLVADASFICNGNVVSGVYKADTALDATHYVDIAISVNTPGAYTVYTDTVNGYYFRAQGNFSSTGVQTIRLKGSGKPLTAGNNVFTVFYDSTNCFFDVLVTGPGGGGSAVFALAGAPGNCTSANVQGAYVAGSPVTVGHTVTLQVNVTTAGSYSLTTATINGITFSSGTGNFSSTGTQTIVLTASGTPTTAGTFNIPVTAGTSTCQFPLTVTSSASPAVYTFTGAPGNCTNAVINGSYYATTALTSANTVVLNVNVTTIGTWNITTTATNGMTFSGSGTFTATGAQTIILNGTGTPVAAGTFNIPVTTGSSTCSFSITCQPVDYFPRTANSNWSYEVDNVSTDTFHIRVIPQTITVAPNTYNIFMYTEDASLGFDSSGYYRRAGGDYYEWVDMGDLWDLDDPLWVEYIFLKDDQSAGFSWTTQSFTGDYTDMSGNTFPVTVRFKYTILQKDINHNINGTAYPNTIVVEERYEQFDGTNWIDLGPLGFGTSRYYYSRNTGLVEIEYYDETNMLITEATVKRYQVY